MGIERTEWRPMVDRGQRRNIQDGTRQDRQSQRNIYYERQRLGRDVERQTKRHMGIHDWALESARQSIDRAKARRNFPLEFRFGRESHIRRRIRLRARFGTEEIETAFDRAADVERDVERFEVRIGGLDSDAFLTVLHDRIVDLELRLRRDHVVGAVTFEKEISSDTKFPVVIRIVNQRRLWEDAFQPQMIGEQPDQTAARRQDWIGIN